MLPDLSKLSINDDDDNYVKDSRPAFHVACRNRDYDAIERLLPVSNSMADLVDADNNTVFHALLAADVTTPVHDDQICAFIMRRLLSYGGPAFHQLIARPDRVGRTPLHLAAALKLRETIGFLMFWWKDVHSQPLGGLTLGGNSVLHSLVGAVKEGEKGEDYVELIRSMVNECKELLFLGDKLGRTPLHIAAQNDQKAIVSLLIMYYL